MREVLHRGFHTEPPREGNSAVRASKGDRLIARAHRGQPDRDAEILEVRGRDGGPPYLVQWSDDGHVGTFFPGPDTLVQHFGRHERRRRTQTDTEVISER
jgi:hypothetical protein